MSHNGTHDRATTLRLCRWAISEEARAAVAEVHAATGKAGCVAKQAEHCVMVAVGILDGPAEHHPRFKLHFIPTSSSWLNQVERFFAEITGKRIRRGVFNSVVELKAAIRDYLSKHNAQPTPFVWTKTADDILAKNARARTVLNAKIGNQASESEH